MNSVSTSTNLDQHTIITCLRINSPWMTASKLSLPSLDFSHQNNNHHKQCKDVSIFRMTRCTSLMSSVTRLNVSHHKLTRDSCYYMVQSCPLLVSLVLDGNPIGDEGLMYVCGAKKLRELSVRSCRIGEDGCWGMMETEMGMGLERLCLAGNAFNGHDVLIQRMKNLTDLDLADCYLYCNEVLEMKFPKEGPPCQLKQLNIEGVSHLWKAQSFMGVADYFSNLQTLKMTIWDNETIHIIGHTFPNLTCLEIRNTCMGPLSLEPIANTMQHLTRLTLDHCHCYGNHPVREILEGKSMKQLQCLHVTDCNVRLNDFVELIVKMNHLTELNISDNTMYGSCDEKSFIPDDHYPLKILNLSKNELSHCFEWLFSSHIISGLIDLDLGSCRLRHEDLLFISSNEKLKNLKRLNVMSNGIDDVTCQQIVSSAVMRNLTYLNVSDGTMTRVGFMSIVYSPYMSNLRQLIVDKNNIRDGDEVFEKICDSPYMRHIVDFQYRVFI